MRIISWSVWICCLAVSPPRADDLAQKVHAPPGGVRTSWVGHSFGGDERPKAASVAAKKTGNMLIGVYIGNKSADLPAFETWIGGKTDAVHAYTSGGNRWGDADPGWQIEMREYLGGTGRRIIWSIPMWPDNGGIKAMREVAAGKHYKLFQSWARKILASRAGDDDPIYVRTTWEMPGEWFDIWSGPAKADPAAYRAAFAEWARAWHDVSPRFKMVWDFNADRGPVEQFYAGDKAVDVISQDVYWTPKLQGNDPVAAFDKTVRGYKRGLGWMADFAKKHGKAMAISEWGVPPDRDCTRWLEAFRAWCEKHGPAYILYWNADRDSGYDGRLTSNRNRATSDAYRRLFGPKAPPIPVKEGNW